MRGRLLQRRSLNGLLALPTDLDSRIVAFQARDTLASIIILNKRCVLIIRNTIVRMQKVACISDQIHLPLLALRTSRTLGGEFGF